MCDMTHVDTLMYTHTYIHMYIHSYMYIHTPLIYGYRIYLYSYLCTSTPTVKHPENKGLIQMCDMTHLYVRHDSTYILNYVMTHPCVWHYSFRCGTATWLIHMRDMTHPYMRHDSYIYTCHSSTLIVPNTGESFRCATWLIQMCDMTHPYVRHESSTCAT